MSLLAPTPLIPGAIAPAPRSSISTNVVLAPLSAETFAVRDSIVVFDSKRLGTSGEGANPVSLGPASSLQDLTAAGRTVQVTALDTPSGLFSFTPRPDTPAAAQTAWTLVDPGGAEARVEGSGYVTLRASNAVLNYDLPIWSTYEIPLQSRVTIVGGDGTEYRGATVTLVIDGATATAAALTARAPAWATLRGTIPNLDPITAGTSYSGLGGVVHSADEYVSENLTKMGFVADGTGILTTGALTFSFNEFEEQLALVENIAGPAAPFDWHGAVWHSSLPPAVVQRLMDHPDEVKALLTTILDTGFAYRPWLGFDVNEVQRTTSPIDADRDYWRGPLYNPPGTGTDGPAGCRAGRAICDGCHRADHADALEGAGAIHRDADREQRRSHLQRQHLVSGICGGRGGGARLLAA